MSKELTITHDSDYEINHIGVLDGIRAVTIIVVVWFHFWQQSWLMPVFDNFSLDWIPRHGCIAVDMMILLSGFCLFLPHARSMVYGTKAPRPGEFFTKRVARIVPSYYIAVIIMFLFAFVLTEYDTVAQIVEDLTAHFTFTHNLFYYPLMMTHTNGVLWTVGVEVQFYLLFPLLAMCFRKKPLITYLGMTAAGFAAIIFFGMNANGTLSLVQKPLCINNPLTFLVVFANGMLGAYCYVAFTKDRKRNKAEGIICTIISIGSIWLYKILCEHRGNAMDSQVWQIENRFVLSLLFLIFVLSTILASKQYRKIWDNKVMKFLAGISFNMYIWHQFIACRLKEFKIPFWSGDTPPNQTGDKVWMWKYQIIIIVVSLAAAIFMTYCVEKPCAKLIMKVYKKHKKNKGERQK